MRVKDYLQTLIENIRAGADPTVQVVEQLEDLSVDKDAATPLGLILNEVVANAFKHAFTDGREGVVTVQLDASTSDGAGVPDRSRTMASASIPSSAGQGHRPAADRGADAAARRASRDLATQRRPAARASR